MSLSQFTEWEVRTSGNAGNGAGFVWLDLIDWGTYKWTASGSGTNEYYCELAAGGDPSLTKASCSIGNVRIPSTEGTMGSLSEGQWDYGDNDTLGYSTIYVRLPGGIDPDTAPRFYVALGKGGGTDYSQQDSAQLSLTDLAMTTGGTTLTSSTGGFTAAMVGNLIYIASGTNFTAGYYEITAYTDINTVTLDRDATDSSNGSSGVGKVGGASTDLSGVATAMIGSNQVYIKYGTYDATVSVPSGSNLSHPISYIGYKTTRGDNPKGLDRPTIDRDSASGDVFYNNASTYVLVANLKVINVGGTSLAFNFSSNGGWCVIKNVHIDSCYRGIGNNGAATMIGVEISNCTNYAVNGRIGWVIGCYIHDNAAGIYESGGTTYKINSIISDNAGGISTYAYTSLINCVISNNTGASTDGLSGTLTFRGTEMILNSIASGNGRYGFNIGNGYITLENFDFNCHYGNGTQGLIRCPITENEVTINPSFTDASNGDFTLQTGSPCLDVGLDAGTYTGATT